MYRIIIVDDESIIIDTIYEIISEIEDYEFEIYKANSGRKAIEIMMRVRPDIVLTDIHMPVMDGLQVQKEIMRQWPDCKVIFLTGYDDFEYIQTALRNESLDYILKVEGKVKIQETVKRAVVKIQNEAADSMLLEKAKTAMKLALPVLQGNYLEKIILGMETDRAAVAAQFKELEISLDINKPVMLLLGRVDAWQQDMGHYQRANILYGIEKIAADHLYKHVGHAFSTCDDKRILWLIQPTNTKPLSDTQTDYDTYLSCSLFVRETTETIQNSCKKMLDISLSMAISAEWTEWSDICEAYKSLKNSLDRMEGLKYGKLLIVSEKDVYGSGGDDSHTRSRVQRAKMLIQRLENLSTYLEDNEAEKFAAFFEEIMESLKGLNEITPLPFYIRKELFYSMMTLLLSHVNELQISNGVCINVDPDIHGKLTESISLDDINVIFNKLASDIFEIKKLEGFKNDSRIFKFIKEYAERNLSGDLSLTHFAEMLHFHPIYLSNLFRQVTGKCFSDYIGEMKVDRAKELIKSSSMKIIEISGLLGFTSQSYFNRFFKKYTGITPNEYRGER